MKIVFICLVVFGAAFASVCGYLIGRKIYTYLQIRKISKSAINDDEHKKDNIFY